MENTMQAAPPPPPPPRRRPDMGNRHPPPPPQKCPRCLSSNTKFCYYNNYSLSQPRYFCKACRRYWTHGGTLRNIPVGGGIRSNRRARPAPPPPPAVAPRAIPAVLRAPIPPPMGNGGSFFNESSFELSGGMNPAPGLQNLGRGQYDGADMALLQSFQSLQPASNDQMFPPQQGLNVNQERLGLRPWTQTFMKGSTSGESSSGFTGRADEGYQAGPNPFDLWSDNNNPSSN